MSGKFRHTNELLMYALLGGVIAVYAMIAIITGRALFLITLPAFMFLAYVLTSETGTYSADLNGIEIVTRKNTLRLTYGEISGVTAEFKPNGHSRSGGTYYQCVLTIYTAKGGKEVFTEDCGLFSRGNKPFASGFTAFAEHIRAHSGR